MTIKVEDGRDIDFNEGIVGEDVSDSHHHDHGIQKRQTTLAEMLVGCLAMPFFAKSAKLIPVLGWPFVPIFKAVSLACPILIATPPY